MALVVSGAAHVSVAVSSVQAPTERLAGLGPE